MDLSELGPETLRIWKERCEALLARNPKVRDHRAQTQHNVLAWLVEEIERREGINGQGHD